MKVTYLGHSAFKIEADEKVIFVDPWLSGPTSPIKVEDVEEVDFCLVTHDHGDHGYDEAIQICKKTGAYFVAVNELGLQAREDGVENVHTLNIGGSVTENDVRITMVQSHHSSSRGTPTGFIVKFSNGSSFYHPGDTGLHASMELFGELYKPDLFFAPVGSYFTMGIDEAAMATKLIRPKYVVPMHYDTFPVIETDPKKFWQKIADMGIKVKVEVIRPGETREFEL